MEYLPSELSIEILGYISKIDLKSIRLVSKRLNALSSPPLFDKVYASLHLKDLEVLSAVSSHPELSLCVKEVVYSGVFFHQYEIKRHKIEYDKRLWRLSELSQRELEQSEEYYRQHVEENKGTLNEKEDIAIISAALSRMPNVRMVTLTNHWRPTRDRVGECSWTGRDIRHVDVLDGVRSGGPLSRAYPFYAKEPCGVRFRTRGRRAGGITIDRGFTVMCRALSIANTRVRMFSIDYVNEPKRFCFGGPICGLSYGSFDMSPRDLVHSCNTFRYLRKVAFSLCMEYTTQEHDILMRGNLAKLLAAAEDLEELTINFDDCMYKVPIPLEKFLGSVTWPRLRSIRLSEIGMNQEEFVDLLKRHSKTLRVLCLDTIRLRAGTWLDTAKEIHAWLDLESISLYHLCELVDSDYVDYKNVITEPLEDVSLYGVSDDI